MNLRAQVRVLGLRSRLKLARAARPVVCDAASGTGSGCLSTYAGRRKIFRVRPVEELRAMVTSFSRLGRAQRCSGPWSVRSSGRRAAHGGGAGPRGVCRRGHAAPVAARVGHRRGLRRGAGWLVLQYTARRRPTLRGHEVDAAFSDLNMLVLPGGRERTEQEYADLFDSAGLHLSRIIDTGTRFSILEAFAHERA